MKNELIIVRYGEIALKGKETRRRFESNLISNIKNALKTKKITNKIRREWGRIFVYSNEIDKCVTVLKKIFGITSISPAIQTSSDIEAISKLAVKISQDRLIGNKSFAIRVTRTGKHNFSSQDIAIKVGDEIVNVTKAKVNLSNPDFELFIEIRDDKAYLFTEKAYCIGGMPLGTQGTAIALIESLQSILAAWYMMRRGCKIVFLTNSDSKEDLLKPFMNNWLFKSYIIVEHSEKKLFNTVKKVAENYNCDAIVTGHTLDTKDNQTLLDLKQLKRDVDLPVITPLIAMKNDEITEKVKEIGLQK